ncbi:hypothetical protein QBC39DRAFT_381140 [Podospora conica]|nr:hypothetical protein QBC39DRAFT_381140 [Schizothecium conicum]
MTMAALDLETTLAARGRPPTFSETTAASSQVADGALPPRPAPPPANATSLESIETRAHTDDAFAFAFPPLPSLASRLPSPRAVRSQSLAIKRKPLSSTASPIATRYSTRSGREYLDGLSPDLPRPEQRFSRSCSLDSPTLYEFPHRRPSPPPVGPLTPSASAAPMPNQPSSPVFQKAKAEQPHSAIFSPTTAEPVVRNIQGTTTADVQTSHGMPHDTASLASQESSYDDVLDLLAGSPEPAVKRTTVINTMPASSRKSPPPHLSLEKVDTLVRVTTGGSTKTENSNLNKPLPRSPASSKFSTFFGWANSPTSATATTFSDRAYSPVPSPYSAKPPSLTAGSDERPTSSKGSRYSNANEDSSLQYCEQDLQTPATATTSLVEIEEMEDELKGISAELASSIRREMDLEDLVERLQEQINNPQAPGKRTSDYFSDSGYSSAKFSEYDHAKEEISQIQRRAEQEMAQLRLELTGKVQEERTQRRMLDRQIEALSNKASQMDMARLHSQDATGRLKELETTCDDLRRKLSEERQVKDNFEDLLSALKGELSNASNERDNLRDEVVPQLRARVEGLEAEATNNAKLAYDASKMQQELQSLRSENTELKKAGPLPPPPMTTLSRSMSVTGGGATKRSRPTSLIRPNTIKSNEPREALADRLKDVEAQRDALHSALRSLLERQEFQNRENQKRIRQLEMERDRLLSGSPKKAGYEREVANLREEITVLRRRAEDAIDQKWEVEKGLGGLKMDLDRAEEEISSLRSLLKENDILIPEMTSRSSSTSIQPVVPVTSASLEKAYRDLQAAYSDALERIKMLETTSGSDEKTKLAMQGLERSLSAALSERDLARSEIASYQTRVDTLETSERGHFSVEKDLADQLRESACRVEELAQQVRAQLETNATLRNRLSDTIARGEAEQRVNKERIAGMQNRLRTLEDQVVAAQTGAEDRVARHEEELEALKEAHSTQLQRLKENAGGMRSPGLLSPNSPFSSMMNSRLSASSRSPRMSSGFLTPNSAARPGFRRSSTTPLDGVSGGLTEQVETLKGRVAELEGALSTADLEMQEVVGRMNTAQIEVMTLQEEREAAVRETRRLQRVLEEERVRVFEERFRTMTTTEVR